MVALHGLSEEQQLIRESSEVEKHNERELFELQRNDIFCYLKGIRTQLEPSCAATAILMTFDLTFHQPSHILLLAEGAIPAVCDYTNSFPGAGLWSVSTSQSKKRRMLNSILSKAVEERKTVYCGRKLPGHVALSISSDLQFENVEQNLEYDFLRCVLKPTFTKNCTTYKQNGMEIAINSETGRILFTVFDDEGNKLDSVGGSFSAIKVSSKCIKANVLTNKHYAVVMLCISSSIYTRLYY